MLPSPCISPLLNLRYEALEKRRSLEAEGYKNSIKILQKKLAGVERQLYRLATQYAGNPQEDQMLYDVKVAAKTSKKAFGDVQHLKSQIYRLEQDLRQVHSSAAADR